MKISYAITVCNEREEIERLVSYLLEHKRAEDEIIVQQDSDAVNAKHDNGVYEYLSEQEELENIKFIVWNLDKDFAQFKNNLNKRCSGDYIFQIDADEIPNYALIDHINVVLDQKPDLVRVPRINTVEGITQEHIKKWRWSQNEEGWINWPDYQSRLYRNDPSIKWEGKVHEQIVGFKTYATLPAQPEWALRHPKTIDRQERQNDFYEGI